MAVVRPPLQSSGGSVNYRAVIIGSDGGTQLFSDFTHHQTRASVSHLRLYISPITGRRTTCSICDIASTNKLLLWEFRAFVWLVSGVVRVDRIISLGLFDRSFVEWTWGTASVDCEREVEYWGSMHKMESQPFLSSMLAPHAHLWSSDAMRSRLLATRGPAKSLGHDKSKKPTGFSIREILNMSPRKRDAACSTTTSSSSRVVRPWLNNNRSSPKFATDSDNDDDGVRLLNVTDDVAAAKNESKVSPLDALLKMTSQSFTTITSLDTDNQGKNMKPIIQWGSSGVIFKGVVQVFKGVSVSEAFKRVRFKMSHWGF